MKTLNRYNIEKLLRKPKPDFSCLTASKEDAKKQHERLVAKIKSFHRDFIPDIDLDHLNLESPQELRESKGDILHSDAFIDKIRKKYLLVPGQIEKVEYHNGIGVYIMLYNDSHINKLIDMDMRDNGYFLSYSADSGQFSLLFFEPLKQANVSNVVFKQDYIYHYTQKSRVNDILKNGLEPRHEREEYMYPNRIYFSLFEDDDLAINLRNSLTRNGKSADKTYSLLRIDARKISRNTQFYFDAFTENCVFTVDGITNNVIEKIKDIGIN